MNHPFNLLAFVLCIIAAWACDRRGRSRAVVASVLALGYANFAAAMLT